MQSDFDRRGEGWNAPGVSFDCILMRNIARGLRGECGTGKGLYEEK